MHATDNNPKRRAGELKVPLQFMPTTAEAFISLVLEGGAKKYGAFNWRKEAISISTYVGAIRRHIGAIADGQDIDPESGLPHWAHIAASCSIALDALTLGKLIDDRDTRGAGPEILAAKAAERAVPALAEEVIDVRTPSILAQNHAFVDAVNRDVLKAFKRKFVPAPGSVLDRYPVGARSHEEVEAWQARVEENDEP